MSHRIPVAILRTYRKASPVFLFMAFLLAGFVLHSFAGGLLSRRPAGQERMSEHAKQIATAFQPFAPNVKTHADDRFFYVESNGIPHHNMMVGITNWQQQVPLPQPYVGQNAWQFPLTPVPAANPLSAKTHFFRGAIAIAADGVPIFNALNNRGEDSYQIGELDEFGGHCGRADDYHYHIAPTHLQKIVGKDKPIGYALDGYALYGLTEPDGSPVGPLDPFNGHTTAKLGYHYHATKTYPYLNGGFHGEVVERGGQVDPQPRAQPVRPDTRPLRGAKIVGFEQPKPGSYSLTYTLDGQTCKVNYALQADGSYKFDYVDGQGQTNTQTYTPRHGGPGNAPPRDRGGDGNGPPRDGRDNGNNPPPDGGADGNRPPRRDATPQPVVRADVPAGDLIGTSARKSGSFVLHSPAVGADRMLPMEFTGDGNSYSPPLEWSGAPAQTKGYAIIMHHIDPQGIREVVLDALQHPFGYAQPAQKREGRRRPRHQQRQRPHRLRATALQGTRPENVHSDRLCAV